jgi:hypothetical protein
MIFCALTLLNLANTMIYLYFYKGHDCDLSFIKRQFVQ